jgi:predicted GH43/DUF377 family glycosyl hydrolase
VLERPAEKRINSLQAPGGAGLSLPRPPFCKHGTTKRSRARQQALFCVALLAFAVPRPPFDRLERVRDKPVLSPQGTGFESAGTFNPAVVRAGSKFVMLYRAQDRNGTSRLGYAESLDGIAFQRAPEPVLSPEAAYEKDGGVEDPRLVRIGALWYLTYTAYNKKDAQLAMATSRDLKHWERKGVILPAYKGRWNVNWTKSGAILDQKINGHYWIYFMADAKDNPNQTGVAYSDDLVHWTEALDHPVLPNRPGKFDATVTEPGPPPVLVREGILLIYNGAGDNLTYRTGWAIFDARDPTKLLSRSDQPIFQPESDWEKSGQVPNVVFVEGLVRSSDFWMLYYGGADKYVGVARCRSQK